MTRAPGAVGSKRGFTSTGVATGNYNGRAKYLNSIFKTTWGWRGSVEFGLAQLIILVSLEQFHHKPMGMHDDGPPSFEIPNIHSRRFVMILL